MSLYLHQKKWETYEKDILNMYRISSMVKDSCTNRAIGYLHALRDNKKIDQNEFSKLLQQFHIKLESVKKQGRKKLG